MTKSVGVHQAKTQLSRLLQDVERGDVVDITRRGVVIARLVPAPQRPRAPGQDVGRFEVPDDFDAPLPDEALDRFER